MVILCLAITFEKYHLSTSTLWVVFVNHHKNHRIRESQSGLGWERPWSSSCSSHCLGRDFWSELSLGWFPRLAELCPLASLLVLWVSSLSEQPWNSTLILRFVFHCCQLLYSPFFFSAQFPVFPRSVFAFLFGKRQFIQPNLLLHRAPLQAWSLVSQRAAQSCAVLEQGWPPAAAAGGVAAAELWLQLCRLSLHRSLSFHEEAGDGAPAQPNCCCHSSPSFFQYHPKGASTASSDKTLRNDSQVAGSPL